MVQILSIRRVVDVIQNRRYISKCCSMIAWSIHEFCKIIQIDFDEICEELRLSPCSFVIAVVTPTESPRITLQNFHCLGMLLREYCSIKRFYNEMTLILKRCLIKCLKLR